MSAKLAQEIPCQLWLQLCGDLFMTEFRDDLEWQVASCVHFLTMLQTPPWGHRVFKSHREPRAVEAIASLHE